MRHCKYILLALVFTLFACCSSDGTEPGDGPGPTPGPGQEELYGLDPDKVEEYELKHKRSEKRGMCTNLRVASDLSIYSSGVSWLYTWGPNVSNQAAAKALVDNDLKFYPMAWNGNFNANEITAYKTANPKCEYILGFNEPNLTDQANMTPQQAAPHWIRLKELADKLNMKLIAPAMNYGTLAGYHDPVKWLDEFFALPGVSLDDVDGIAIHCYMGNASSMANYVKMFYKYGKPIWLTEFCAWEQHINTQAKQIDYMCDALNFLEADPNVFAYAWFMDRTSGPSISYPFYDIFTKTNPNELNILGKVYTHMSSMDKEYHYKNEEIIPAASYSALPVSESAPEGVFKTGIKLRPATDSKGILEIYNFGGLNWVEYLIDVPEDGNYRFDLRYAAKDDAKCEVITANKAYDVELKSTIGFNVWKSTCTVVKLKKGKQTIRVNPTGGWAAMHWFRFVKL